MLERTVCLSVLFSLMSMVIVGVLTVADVVLMVYVGVIVFVGVLTIAVVMLMVSIGVMVSVAVVMLMVSVGVMVSVASVLSVAVVMLMGSVGVMVFVWCPVLCSRHVDGIRWCHGVAVVMLMVSVMVFVASVLSEVTNMFTFPDLNGTNNLTQIRLDRASIQVVPPGICNHRPWLKSL